MRKCILVAASFLSYANISLAETPSPQQQINQFVQDAAHQTHFSETQLQALFTNFKPNEKVLHWIQHPYEEKPWYVYEKHFVNPKKIALGVSFWQEHKSALQYASKQYGVPPQTIVAIIGMESEFGNHLANYNEIEALGTLAFYYPPRSRFFRYQLEQFLQLSHKFHWQPQSIEGSYAGAIGLMQFMPDNCLRYATRYHANKKLDLSHHPDDAIVSVANFLKHKGWRRGQAIMSPTKTHVTSKRFIKLQGADKAIYFRKRSNFRAVMSYNPHINYVATVYKYGQALAAEYQLTHKHTA